jgi:hypothetical protein
VSEIWENVTVAQALLVVAGLWLLFRTGELVIDLVRRLRGLPPLSGWVHCEHCSDVEALDERVNQLGADSEASAERLSVLEEALRPIPSQTSAG